jgi:hypothetical protein
MSLVNIPNQVIDFKNIALSENCNCKGQSFVRKVNKNDVSQVQFISTIINSNPNFDNGFTNLLKAYIDSYITPNPITSYFVAVDTIGVCDGTITITHPLTSFLVLNQYEFSIDNGLTWLNETTLPSLVFTGLCAGVYECIIRDTIYGTDYSETIIIN